MPADLGKLPGRAGLGFDFPWFREAVRTMTAAGLAAVAAAQMIGLGEDDVWAVVVELTGFGDGRFAILGLWCDGGHASIFA
jgi:hypothetical protein